jgi:hypothetical protein
MQLERERIKESTLLLASTFAHKWTSLSITQFDRTLLSHIHSPVLLHKTQEMDEKSLRVRSMNGHISTSKLKTHFKSVVNDLFLSLFKQKVKIWFLVRENLETLLCYDRFMSEEAFSRGHICWMKTSACYLHLFAQYERKSILILTILDGCADVLMVQ